MLVILAALRSLSADTALMAGGLERHGSSGKSLALELRFRSKGFLIVFAVHGIRLRPACLP